MSSGANRLSGSHLVIGAALLQICSVATAQTAPNPAGSGANSLIQNPQRGAAPAPLEPRTVTPPPVNPVPAPASRVALPTLGPPAPLVVRPVLGTMPAMVDDSPAPPLRKPDTIGLLPAPTDDPLALDIDKDPMLALFEAYGSHKQFVDIVAQTIDRNPARDEALAQRDVADATRAEARSGLFPVVDLSMTYFKVIAREFSNNPNNILERQRPAFRTDAIIRIQQPIIDFGSTVARIKAGNRRVDAAIETINDSSAQVGLRTVSAWNLVFGYRALVRLGEDYAQTLGTLRTRLQDRVRQGVSAAADLAQVDSYLAASNTQLAQFQRSLASAEAQFQELTGSSPPQGLGRVPSPGLPLMSLADAQMAAEDIPAVVAAKLQTEAARLDAKAVKADELPGVTVGVDAGRYGVFENARDYDIRGTVTLSQRLFGGAVQRTEGARARARGVEASYRRIREEATRDSAIAWSDVNALEEARRSIKENYAASRRSRDVLAERFRVSRGTPLDLLNTENNFYNVAVQYIQTVIELDTARYVLMARTGKLLDVLEIPSAQRKRR